MLTLHPKLGVNPSVSLCYFCGKDKEVVLLGYNGGKEAPREAYFDKEPCDKCLGHMEQGIICLSVKDDDPDYRTGGFVVVKDDALEKIFDSKSFKAAAETRSCLITDSAWEQIGFNNVCDI